jgi:ubiquinone/menaquinone biosynthesis C-methylase UbiE
MNWILGIAVLGVLGLIGYLLDREIYFYEGVHLGPRLQAWLYDRWSKKYDEGKRASQLQDDDMLAQPLLDALRDVPQPFILDFATGTGRLSFALLNREEFNGRIVAVDLSQGMLERATAKLSHASTAGQKGAVPPVSARVEFLRHLSLPLPFPDQAFDAVCALEVLELFPDMDEPLRELTRVLRPGGVLLTSRGTEESGRKAKVKSASQFNSLLETHGMEQIKITKWWKLFDRVIAVKRGASQLVTFKKLSEVLICSACHARQWSVRTSGWKCQVCGKELPVTREGIILN